MKRYITPSFAALVLAACTPVYNGANQALSVSEQHPISVEQQTETLNILVDVTTYELGNIDKARLRAFADAYFVKGNGPITITAPSGSASDYRGQELAADVRNELYAAGVDWDRMLGATYRASGDETAPELMVSFTRYVASPSACGDWSNEYFRRSHNLRHNNFGCATQNNIAAMISDPGDLIDQRELGKADAGRQVDVMNKYRQGIRTTADDEPLNTEEVSE